ncbi:hypothetical protein C404_16985 [Ralstonia sp. AU12-08]|nr:hypothetical protein C404_16985 [Ralstonia sp. AU12-08]
MLVRPLLLGSAYCGSLAGTVTAFTQAAFWPIAAINQPTQHLPSVEQLL